MLPPDLQGLATRWLANLPGWGLHPFDYTTLPGRTSVVSPEFEYDSFSKHLWVENRLLGQWYAFCGREEESPFCSWRRRGSYGMGLPIQTYDAGILKG